MASKEAAGYKCRIALVLFLLLGSIAALIAVAVIQNKWSFTSYSMEYGIVIDSGSSRSNIYLYEWPGEKQNETGIVKEVMNCRVAGDGISEMKVDPEKDAASWKAFKACMTNISKAIPEEKHKKTPLFLGATAGMRLLEESNKPRAMEIMESLRQYLSALPFNFQNASIISGQEEGLYGWITVNYIMENFFEKNMWNKYVRPEGGQTFGSMDLGGASTQIAFTVGENLTGEDYLHVKLYGYNYNVYTHSFLCYGKNEAEKQVLDKIIQQSSNPDLILNPCYPDGLNITHKASDIYDTTCTKIPGKYNLNQTFFMVGTGDSEECKKTVRMIFDFDTCNADQCSFNGVEQPPVFGEYMAYAGFFFTARAIGDNEDLDTFRAAISKFCHTSWVQLKKEKTWISDRYLKTYCFAGHYVFSLLTEGYKFDKNTWPNIHFEKEIKKTSIGWSLGYMLSLSNMIPSDVKENFPMSNPLFAGLIFLFSVLTIITLVIVFIFCVRTCY
ncbi:ectonucleoside triphosphate diphosphohydrolase 3 [Periophthalmus magnuspinnatus]|uniref:ectonucleoside triphosphate diphosphohydrolase 3 n=1 Tax=Periophthalmus magnuspinnatus TaxID=409849 RepID=UPI00145C0AE6|nr:ectonucleoside triphosphate diphosphohydrolase 3 [Periophthalmus magnuspinnatus]